MKIVANVLLMICLGSSVVCAQDQIRVGIIEYKSEEKVTQTFAPIVQYLGTRLNLQSSLEIVNENDLGFRLNRGDFEVGVFTVFPYLRAKTDFPDLSVFATHQVQGQDHYKGYILTRPEVKNYSDLKESKLLFVKPSSTSGFKIPQGILTEHDIDINSEYLSYDFAGDHTAALWALDSGRVDAIAVDDERYHSFQGPNKGGFNVLSEFSVPYHAYVFGPEVTAERKEEIRSVLSNAHRDPDSRALFDNPLDVTQIIAKDDNYYNELRRYMRLVRVKPSVVVAIKPTENALEVLGNRDIILLLEGRIQQELQNSHRFSSVFIEEGEATYTCIVDLFYTEEGVFNYQVKLNDKFIGDGEIATDQFRKKMPVEFSQWLLKSLPLTTELLFNGEDWFITYGTDDGINGVDYQFDVRTTSGEILSLDGDDVRLTTELNIVFKDQSAFAKDEQVFISYKTPIGQATLFSEDEESHTYNIFSRAFWQGAGLWDKIGLIGGIIFALASGFVGRILASRKKKRFKNILYQTNDLIKEYVEGQYRMESKLIEQKEFISHALEEGHINENQFLILQNRIEDMQALIESRGGTGDVLLTDEHAEEIREIISDGKVTEREFTKIMNIIKRGSPNPSSN